MRLLKYSVVVTRERVVILSILANFVETAVISLDRPCRVDELGMTHCSYESALQRFFGVRLLSVASFRPASVISWIWPRIGEEGRDVGLTMTSLNVV